MTKKKASKTNLERAESIAPIRFDEQDERSLEVVRAALWLRPGKRYVIDIVVQCLRLATEAVAASPTIWKQFDRENAGITATGRMRAFRLLPTERLALDRLAKAFGGVTRAEAMRLAIRIAGHACANGAGR